MAKTQIVEDAVTGERVKLIELPRGQASWLFAPNLVCECTRCRTRFRPDQLAQGCPQCCSAAAPQPHPPAAQTHPCAPATAPPNPCAPPPQVHAEERVIPVSPGLHRRT